MPRILVRTPSPAVRLDLLQDLSFDDPARRSARTLSAQPDVLVVDADDRQRERIIAAGGMVYEDVQFETFPGQADAGPTIGTFGPAHLSLREVLSEIRAPDAWTSTRGAGVTVAIVDTGVSGALRELPAARRSSHDLRTAFRGRHWEDPVGHGSMCAAIAAASTSAGGRYDGVAPDAEVLSVRSDLTSTDLTLAFDELLRLRATGTLAGPMVISNSWGVRACTPPGTLRADHPFVSGVEAAVDAGIFVCFAAGNNHHDYCSFDPAACSPSTIWGANSLDRVVTVGTVSRDRTNQDAATPHANSSRGPGEWASRTMKPDCVAPTYGEVPWGKGYLNSPWWGTSGACPQVAGAAALVLSIAPSLAPHDVADIIRMTCLSLPGGPTCVGRGLLNCEGAVAEARIAAA